MTAVHIVTSIPACNKKICASFLLTKPGNKYVIRLRKQLKALYNKVEIQRGLRCSGSTYLFIADHVEFKAILYHHTLYPGHFKPAHLLFSLSDMDTGDLIFVFK